MKKFITMAVLAGFVAVSTVGCEAEKPKPAAKPATTTPDATKKPDDKKP